MNHEHVFDETVWHEKGLGFCTACRGAEGGLPSECPGTPMSADAQDLVYAQLIDYRNGAWVPGTLQQLAARMLTLPAGTLLYHGTDSDEFAEADDDLEGPAWLSRSCSVARRFATRRGGVGRIITYELTEALQLVEISAHQDMQDLARHHHLHLDDTDSIRDSVARSGLPGWIIPHNYPDGDDILIVDTHLLQYLRTESA